MTAITVRWLDQLARMLLPPRCLVCGLPAGGRDDLCDACAAELPWNDRACARCGVPLPAAADQCGDCLKRPPPFAATRALFRYAAPVDLLMGRLKFHRDLAAGRLLAGLFAQRLAPADAATVQVDALLPVPLHRQRLGSRGYNQSLELARPLAKRLGLPLLRDGLVRVNATAAQTGLDRTARRRNLRGAFAWQDKAPPPARIALIDDTMTTGSTVGECARVLLRAGAVHVEVWVVARVAPPGAA